VTVFLEAIRNLDLAIYHYLTGFAGNWILDRMASHEEGNNLLKGGLFLAVYAYWWFRIESGQKTRRATIVSVVFGTLVALVVARSIAFCIPLRLRPSFDPSIQHPAYSFPIAPNLEDWGSFPSDNATYFFALAFGLTRISRRLGVAALLYTVAWVCFPRLYLGIHFASDILGGAAVGITTVWIFARSQWLRSRIIAPVLAMADGKPQWFYPTAALLSFEMAYIFGDIRDAGRGLIHLFRVRPDLGVWFHYGPIPLLTAIPLMYLLWQRRRRQHAVSPGRAMQGD